MKKTLIILLIMVATITFTLLSISVSTKKVTYKGVVIEHFVTSDRSGYPHYRTIARFDDGYTRELLGFDYYTTPIGSTIYYSELKLDIK